MAVWFTPNYYYNYEVSFCVEFLWPISIINRRFVLNNQVLKHLGNTKHSLRALLTSLATLSISWHFVNKGAFLFKCIILKFYWCAENLEFSLHFPCVALRYVALRNAHICHASLVLFVYIMKAFENGCSKSALKIHARSRVPKS